MHAIKLVALGGVVLALGLGLLARAWVAPDEASADAAMWGATAAALGAALMAWRGVIHDPERGWPRPGPLALAMVGGAALTAALTWAFGHRHFGGFDMGAVVDLAWRLANGQRPYADFPSTTPIGFLLGAGLAFKAFGASWSALVGWQALAAAIGWCWSLALLVAVSGRWRLALLLAGMLQATTSWVHGYWWYNPATTMAAALYFLSAALLWKRPASPVAAASYVAALALVAAAKPNVAGPLIAGVTVAMVLVPALRRRVIACSAAALVLYAAGLAAFGIAIGDVVGGYLAVSGRGLTLRNFLQDLTDLERKLSLALLVAALAPWLVWLNSWWRAPRGLGLALPAALAGLAGFLTNGEHKVVDLPLLILALWWLGAEDRPRTGAPVLAAGWSWPAWRAYVAAFAALAMVFGLSVGALRLRVRSIGPFFSYEVAAVAPARPFFRGMATSRDLVDVDARIAAALASRRATRPFFGPRLTWGYAAYGFVSPVGQPVWWHGGVSYAPAREAAMVAAWADARHDVLIFLREEYIYVPPALWERITRDYALSRADPRLDVWTRRVE